MTLEDKLKEAVSSACAEQEGVPIDFEWLNSDPIEQITQAFVEAGWRDLGEIGSDFYDYDRKQIEKLSLISPKKPMTDPEWYAKLMRELSDVKRPSVDTFKVVDVKEAARRASGMEEKE